MTEAVYLVFGLACGIGRGVSSLSFALDRLSRMIVERASEEEQVIIAFGEILKEA